MIVDKVSIVMTLPSSRVDYLKWTLPSFAYQNINPSQLELVAVEDIAEGQPRLPEYKLQLLKIFGSVQWIVMDKRKSIIPAKSNCPALGLNIGFRNASHEAIYKTDPECLQINTLAWSLQNFDPNKVVYMQCRRTDASTLSRLSPPPTSKDAILSLPGLLRPHVRPGMFAPWWYGMLASKNKIMEIGGVDERTMSGFAGDDDIFGHVMKHSGAQVLIIDEAEVVHLWHPAPNNNGKPFHLSPEHHHNINLLHRCINEGWKKYNENHDWGSDQSVVSKETWKA